MASPAELARSPSSEGPTAGRTTTANSTHANPAPGEPPPGDPESPGPRYEGTTRRIDGRAAARPFRIRPLLHDDFVPLRRLHHEIVGTTPAGLVARESDPFLERNLATTGRSWGVEVDGGLVAYAILNLGGPEHADLAGALDLDGAELERFAVLDGVGVLPALRGNGFHRRLTQLRIACAQAIGRCHVAATVAPPNMPSWRNLLLEQLQIVALRRMFGGHWRYLMLRSPHLSRPLSEVDAIEIDTAEIRLQESRLRGGWRGISGRIEQGRALLRMVPGAPR